MSGDGMEGKVQGQRERSTVGDNMRGRSEVRAERGETHGKEEE